MALDATVGGVSANSYVTVADGDTYAVTRVNATAWTAASTGQKEAALVSATNRLEQERWAGAKTDEAQRLAWPRTGTTDPDGVAYADDAIPRPVSEATYELAISLLESPDSMSGNALEQFESLSVGPISLTTRAAQTNSGRLPAVVTRLLDGLRTTLGSGFRIVRT